MPFVRIQTRFVDQVDDRTTAKEATSNGVTVQQSVDGWPCIPWPPRLPDYCKVKPLPSH